jgi:hypothetical protein
MNQLKHEYIRHVKPITQFSSFYNLALKHLNHVKTPALQEIVQNGHFLFTAENDPL